MTNVRLVKVYKKTYPESEDGGYSYDISVRYYPKVYFQAILPCEIADWLTDNFNFDDITFFIPEDRDTGTFWEIGKDAFRRVLADAKLFADCLDSSCPNWQGEPARELRDFLKDAIDSDVDDDIVRIELW